VTTKLAGPLKRELEVGGQPFVLTITPEGLKLSPKGKRRGHEMAWSAFVNGDAALATALNASIANGPGAVGPRSDMSGRTSAGRRRHSGNEAE